MFSALSSAFGYLLGKNTDGPGPTDSKKQTKIVKNINVNGSVTSLHDGYGIIDKVIYFTFDKCVGNKRPNVGENVSVQAFKDGDESGWRAKTVYLQEESWIMDTSDTDNVDTVNEKTNDQEKVKAVVGSITSSKSDGGTINNYITFQSADVVSGYNPYEGDWVLATHIEDDCGFSRAVDIRPAREIEFTGEVNTLLHGFGFIDREIYFQFDVCFDGLVPDRGDMVTGKAIESCQKRCNWRAISVKADESTKHGFFSPIVNSPTQSSFQQKLLANKCGIVITYSTDFGQVAINNEKVITVLIGNGGNASQTFLQASLKCGTTTQFTLLSPKLLIEGSEEISAEGKITLHPGMSIHITAECSASTCGIEKVLAVFQFDGFKIGRYLCVCVYDPIQRDLEPNAPYQRQRSSHYRSLTTSATDACIIPGQRPQRKTGVRLPFKLPQYPIPADLRECYRQDRDLLTLVPDLVQPLCMDNYITKFSTLLHLEEIQMEIDIREFDLERECLRRCGEFLGLKVPGLAEGRPSVLVGDKVILSEPGDTNGPMYEGFIHEVLYDEVLLKLHPNFHMNYQGEDYNVAFTFGRTPMRRCHQAVRFVSKLGKEVLFPMKLISKLPQVTVKPKEASDLKKKSCVSGKRLAVDRTAITQHHFYNEKLNQRQRCAVLRIVGGQCRPIPYILFGPPGTGKTVTLVEAILQIFHHVSGSRIIACAPSNSAADLLAERLHLSGHIKQGDMVRLNAFRRNEENVPALVQPYCSDGENLELMARYRLIVCTCSTAGSFYALNVNPGHFTHAVIDEAGQATEPECVSVIGLVANAEGQTILAGDPMQLGPVLRSNLTKDYGLQLSMLERLMTSDLFLRDEKKFADHGSYDPLLVTKLVNNYRSHPAIMNISSEIFYHNELEVCADKANIEFLCKWEDLPRKDFPVIFHGLRGEDMREGNSPSWFNPAEVVQVIRYLQRLVNNPQHKLSYDDIGIVTPYRKQVEKIRLLIDRLGMDKVKVGSVEEFQGQERPVIIISTVRSNENHVNFDLKYNLGFLSNPKRFNVSISRAQALLIVIGNPYLLANDPYWLRLLKYAVTHGAYTGCDIPPFDSPISPDQEVLNSTEEQKLCSKEIDGTSTPFFQSSNSLTICDNSDQLKTEVQSLMPEDVLEGHEDSGSPMNVHMEVAEQSSVCEPICDVNCNTGELCDISPEEGSTDFSEVVENEIVLMTNSVLSFCPETDIPIEDNNKFPSTIYSAVDSGIASSESIIATDTEEGSVISSTSFSACSPEPCLIPASAPVNASPESFLKTPCLSQLVKNEDNAEQKIYMDKDLVPNVKEHKAMDTHDSESSMFCGISSNKDVDCCAGIVENYQNVGQLTSDKDKTLSYHSLVSENIPDHTRSHNHFQNDHYTGNCSLASSHSEVSHRKDDIDTSDSSFIETIIVDISDEGMSDSSDESSSNSDVIVESDHEEYLP